MNDYTISSEEAQVLKAAKSMIAWLKLAQFEAKTLQDTQSQFKGQKYTLYRQFLLLSEDIYHYYDYIDYYGLYS